LLKSLESTKEVGALAKMVDETEKDLKAAGSKRAEIEFAEEILILTLKYKKLTVD